MLQRPQFQPHVQAHVVEGEGVFLLSETGAVVLQGRLPQLVVPLVDGRRTVDEIADSLVERASAAEVYYAVNELERQHHLVEGELPIGRSEAAWWTLQGVDPHTAAQRLADTNVTVTSVGDIDDEPIRSILSSMGIVIGQPSGLLVAVTDDYLRDGLRLLNEEALRHDAPWLAVKPVGTSIWLGPLFRPGTTACWECMAQRLRGNRAAEMHLWAGTNGADVSPPPQGCSPTTAAMASNLAAVEAARWVVRGQSPCEGTLISMDVRSGSTHRHIVQRRPQCAACGRPGAGRRDGPIALESERKAVTSGGGHRAVAPEQTLTRFQHHVSPLTGAVTRLERSAPAAGGVVHLYRSSYALTTRHESLNALRNSLRRTCGGKGATDVAARVSGLGEALERYSAVFAGDEPCRRTTQRQLGDAAVEPNSCLLFSDRQYAERDRWNAREGHFCRVSLRFEPDEPMDWSPVWSLTRNERRYLPTGLCYLGYPLAGEDRFVETSNGLAAGNTVTEAVFQGFLELVERDSSAVWWYNRLRRPAVDWTSFDDEQVRRVADFLQARGRSLWILDLTGDLGVPVFAALSRRVDGNPEQVVMGFGAHLDAAVALVRAVTELTQMLMWVVTDTGAKRVPEAALAPIAADWLRTATLAGQPYLAPDPAMPPRRQSDFPRLWSDDLRDDVRFCQSLVERQGMEVLVLDLTRPDVELPVVRVVVPGLRPLWSRLAPGRLYDVPVRQGWLSQALGEDQLNPVPMFL